ncbi:hypothetical protein QEZ48_19580 [Aquamicrobium lusatiense]|uniref:hypothetical protein n=1 Tax=Aquamicrobium lusatiense TaxID=89772 RepID=UPI00245587A0|nr:hypothetical protein [Aquamicrobium lusatiense]MDH4993019.1 hypothetical protein [Aquamicrobium lusatiense]
MSKFGDPKTERVAIMMSKAQLQAIDDWAWRHRIRSLSEAIRILCEHGMTVETAGEKTKPSKPERSA